MYREFSKIDNGFVSTYPNQSKIPIPIKIIVPLLPDTCTDCTGQAFGVNRIQIWASFSTLKNNSPITKKNVTLIERSKLFSTYSDCIFEHQTSGKNYFVDVCSSE